MKTLIKRIAIAGGLLLLMVGCSTKKNTWLSRNYQALNVRYNVYFNGYEAYREGVARIDESHVDDYSEILLMFPISYHSNASAGQGDMTRAAEKAEKSIKTRSIRKKPKRNSKKYRDPNYQAFYNQEEFNVMIDDSWLLLGKSQFYQADFLSAMSTFTYVIRHFSGNKEVVSEAQLWLARSYAELGWLYEAQDALNKINKDDFTKNQSAFFAAIDADLKLKEKDYTNAISSLLVAIDGEKDKPQKARFQYILGQLYMQQGNKDDAYKAFTAVIKSSPPFEMELNARLMQAETHGASDKESMLKMLGKMVKNSKNADYLDQIYTAIGNIYQEEGDTSKAIENYKLAIEKSTRNGYEKAQALILLADLYYEQEKYIEAQPYYVEAVTLMNPESADFARVDRLAQYLTELNENLEVVALQDSLQWLSRLPEAEQTAQIQKIIDGVVAAEKEAERLAEEERLRAENAYGQSQIGSYNTNTNMLMNMNDGRSASFYFYNPQLVAAGKTDFVRKWGTRKLEDNWRRQVKTQVAMDDIGGEEYAEDGELLDENGEPKELADADNNKKHAFYTKQLYTKPEQFEASDEEIMTGLYNAGFIYNDKILNTPKAIETFEELARRYPDYDKLPEVYFYLYQTYVRQNAKAKADVYRRKLIAEYPNDRYARILSQPDYEQKLINMGREQDELYEKTYYAYLASNFQQVFANYAYMEKNYPASELMPKFALLNAMSIAKTDTHGSFKKSLEDLLVKYPNSDVTSIAKDMLALMSQGKESQTGSSHGDLIALRDRDSKATSQDASGQVVSFNPDVEEVHYFVIYLPKGRVDINKLQYNVAAYNFTKFIIKDFDIELRSYDEDNLLIVRTLENLDEALWYQSGILSDNYLKNEIANNGLTTFVVSKDNFGLIFSDFSVDEYIQYFNNVIAKGNTQQVVDRSNQPVVKKPTQQATSQPAETTKQEPQPQVTTPSTQQTAPETTATPEQPQATQPAEASPADAQATTPTTPQEEAKPVEPKKELPKFRGLYTFDETAKHYFAFYVVSGDFDFEKIKADIGKYNAENYPLLNLQITQAMSGKQKVILVGTLPDAASAKSYLLRIVKSRELFAGLQSAQYRNIIITKENLNTLNRVGNPSVYLDFLRETYLK